MSNRKTLLMLLFAALAIAQLFIPIRMIISKERMFSEGVAYKFRIVPVDPYDPFMGRYIVLHFELSTYEMYEGREPVFEPGQEVYVYLTTDSEGYAAIYSVDSQCTMEGDCLLVKVEYDHGNALLLNFPFNRYYMTEDAAQAAERAYNRLSGDRERMYALVRVMDGEGAIEGVYVDGVRLEDYLRTVHDYDEGERTDTADTIPATVDMDSEVGTEERT